MSSPPNEDDSDLEDLLTSQTTSPNTTNTTTTENVNIDLDHLTREGDAIKNKRKHHHYYSHHSNPSVSPLMFCYAHCTTFTHTHPRTCTLLLLTTTLLMLVTFINILFNPTSEIGVVQHDYTNVQSSFQLNMGSIDHWCLMGDDNSCTCEDPLEASHRGESKSWRKGHKANMETVEGYRDDVVVGEEGEDKGELDVAIVGESVVELMDGRWMGMEESSIKDLDKEFRRKFDRSRGADIEGVALGIAGDTSPNILWRLQHGEMPSDFNPKIFWIVAGMNDLARTQCSEEVTVIGILRLVEEILERKPKAQIVLNSLFPMLDLRGGINPHHADMEDAFRNRPNRGRYWRGNNDGGKGDVVPQSHFAKDPKMIAELKAKQAAIDRGDDRHHTRHLASSESNSSDDNNRKHTKKEPINPLLKEPSSHNFRHRDPKTFFTKRRDPPLWPAVEAINAELHKFCQKHDRVHFVDSTDLFVTNANTAHGDKRLNSDLISWRGRPNFDGFKVWEDSIVEKVKYILAKEGVVKKEKKKPEEEDKEAKDYVPSETVGQEEGNEDADENEDEDYDDDVNEDEDEDDNDDADEDDGDDEDEDDDNADDDDDEA